MRVLAWPAWKGTDLNPYTGLLYDAMPPEVEVTEFSFRRMLACDYDVLHMHWPEVVTHGRPIQAATRAAALLLGLRWARLRHRSIVWTRHNRSAHSGPNPRLATLVERAALRASTALIYLSRASQLELEPDNRRQVISAVTPHGRYHASKEASTTVAAAARPSVAWFGRVRAYKGLDKLLELSSREAPWTLAVAGQPDDANLASLTQDRMREAGGKAILRHLTEDELDRFLAEADLVCLPYRQFQNSGSVFRALATETPVLVPRTPTMEELSEDVGAGWVHMYDGDLTSSVVVSALAAGRPASSPNWARYEWPAIAALTASAYQASLARALPTTTSR